MILQVRHLADSSPARFQVQRLSDGRMGPPTDAVPDPVGFPVDGWPDVPLLTGLRWYLEQFLDYPFDPETTHAELVQRALRRWGELAFDSLFNNADAGVWFHNATEKEYADLHLQVVSDDPGVLAWPWEALYDRKAGCRLAHACQVERLLDGLRDPPKGKKLPKDRVHILLVIARPFQQDVRFRSIARPLVEWAARPDVPADVHVLRPPTFVRLREHLRQHRGRYHILHFDGHGAYGDGQPAAAGSHKLQGTVQGRLVFEDVEGGPDLVAAETLSELLRECAVPAVVLNACQSAMVDGRADDPFASVAAALLKSGTRSVTAMAYSLYVSGAQQFLPAFYQRLFEAGEMADAVRAGRQQMLSRPGRVCARGTFALDDWLVPVLYQQKPPDLKFVKKAKPKEAPPAHLPEEAREQGNPYGFVGRDGPLLELERALHRKPAGILVSGLGGVGKTSLARGFLHWLEQTGGIGDGVLWFSFADIRSAEFVLNRLGEALYEPNFGAVPDVGQKLALLESACRQKRLLLVWDNFESARGVAGTAVTANLPPADCDLLRDLLGRLRGGPTKVLITSRSTEDWLGLENRYLLPLGGLDGEERWEFANAILHDLGRKVQREDKALAELMGLLNGHPLAMRVILPRLENRTAAELTEALRRNSDALRSGAADENEARLYATLRFATDALPTAWQPLLIALAQHEGYVQAGLLEVMAQQVDAGWARGQIDDCLGALANGGLLRGVRSGLWEMHPAVSGFLRSALGGGAGAAARDAWVRAFVTVMADVAGEIAPRPLHEQRGPFYLWGGSFHSARTCAQRLEMSVQYQMLTLALAAYCQNTFDYCQAAHLFQQMADFFERMGMETAVAGALHQLGIVAQKRRDLAAAEGWYRKALAIWERHGDEHGAALAYHQLGRVAEERRDYAAAADWYCKALAIKERLGNEHGAAATYHQLGRVAEECRDLAAAEGCYRKALAIWERHGDEHGAASTYHQLGRVAQERRDYASAEGWYRKALAVKERLGDEHDAALAYHQLGTVAQERRDYASAEGWYRKALAIKERLGDEHGAAGTYHQLGRVAEERRDHAAAEGWYHKALAIQERLGDEHGAATTYGSLGQVAAERQDWAGAEGWFAKALAIFEKLGDEHFATVTRLEQARLAGQRQGPPESTESSKESAP